MKYLALEVLKLLKSSSGYVSGSEIARKLGLSRSTVNKVINELKRLGYVIETHPRLGYKLLDLDDLSLSPLYPPSVNGRRISIHYMERCSSTQDVADTLAREGAEEGTVVVAEELSSARGRLGRKWVAPRGGLWMTIVLRPSRVECLHSLSIAMGVAVARGIELIAGVEPKLKWPNDLVIDGRKLGGILIEARAEADRLLYALVGIGINVNNEIPPELQGFAVSLREVLGKRVPRVPLLRSVVTHLFEEYDKLLSGHASEVVKEWKQLSYTLGKHVRVKLVDGSVVEGVAIDVDRLGRLIIDSEGRRIVIDSGDVEHLR
ncbi:MAG: biotin--[acetyl-CoA-carboxylase] ligase [Crenarchaeota archaeon]|nr:biotin--[acetyl-CoA-carboxylase] ligase [Thermoproteota archaeon]